MSERPHLSIGEVLGLLQEDFPDITISKIRFLESQGLLDPERTPSGYRKFYDDDIARLRWILYQQRENFLPLKIIKDRLSRGDVDFEAETAGVRPSEAQPGVRVGVDGETESDSAPAPSGTMSAAGLLQEAPGSVGSGSPSPASVPSKDALVPPLSSDAADDDARDISLTLDELCKETGLTARDVGELERYGMLTGRALGSTAYYDGHAVEVARLASAFLDHGIEARHLRMYLMAAQREVGLFEQLLLPILRRRGAASRSEAATLAGDLIDLGEHLQGILVRQLLADYLDQA